MNNQKAGFSGKIGFILAAAGSAVGLGNIWRFPYLAAQYGGGIFLLVYLVLAVTFGFALMVTEVAIGRKTGMSAIKAFGVLNKKGSFIGVLASLVPMIIFPYYCVIGGWVIKYGTVFITGEGSAAAADGYFGEFIGSPVSPLIFTGVFILLTSLVVLLGVQKGIEKISKLLMPILLVLTIGISVYSLSLDGAMEGLIYYVKPNFNAFSLKTVIAAMGQMFYSMSLAMGIMITYGSYMQKKDNLESSVRSIEIFDTAIAFLSGLMIIPAVFAFSGGDKSALNQGPGLMFVTLPKVFDTMAGGNIVGIVFFILVFFAALTSSISLMETIVSIIMDKFKIKRSIVCVIVMAASMIIAVPSSLGNGIWSDILILGKDFLSFFDFLSNNIMMPITALLTCIFVGFVIKTKTVEDEVEVSGAFKAKKLYRIMVTYICPVFLIVILISSIIGYV
ncbi:MAG: sodium-dependent transporter [Oscillospiraceae bacterium]|nr:sodium-dependent transporter [Ruminococcus sp.]MDD6098570.1 sodium-dependent transporter [Oscillospiraceae bacterium]